MVSLSRRGFLAGILAAPAIVRIASIMPVKAIPAEELLTFKPWTPDYLAVPMSTEEAIKLWSRKLARETLRKTYLQHFSVG